MRNGHVPLAGSTADDDEKEEEDSVVIQYRIVPPESGQCELALYPICDLTPPCSSQ